MHGGQESWSQRAIARIGRALSSRWHTLGRLPIVRGFRARQWRRLQPLANGKQRGTPIVRYHWEQFLKANKGDIRGKGLEVGGTGTLTRIGGSAITRAEALDFAQRPGVDVVADLSRADAVASETYDCLIVPFTTHFIYDIESALHHAVRILKPGGTLLVNFVCVDYYLADGLDMATGKPLFVFWWFTPLQVENLLRRCGLAGGDFQLRVDGNLLTRVAFQMNLPVEELTAAERDHEDAGHPLLISARIVKPVGWHATRPEPREPWLPKTTPAKWNPVTGHYPADLPPEGARH